MMIRIESSISSRLMRSLMRNAHWNRSGWWRREARIKACSMRNSMVFAMKVLVQAVKRNIDRFAEDFMIST